MKSTATDIPPYLSAPRFCKECGADMYRDGICIANRHIFIVNPYGICQYCGRNGISCECND